MCGLPYFKRWFRMARKGCPAGILAEKVGVTPSSLSFHVHVMTAAGLVRQRRMRRNFIYAIDNEAFATLNTYLSAKMTLSRLPKSSNTALPLADIIGSGSSDTALLTTVTRCMVPG